MFLSVWLVISLQLAGLLRTVYLTYYLRIYSQSVPVTRCVHVHVVALQFLSFLVREADGNGYGAITGRGSPGPPPSYSERYLASTIP